MHRIVFTICLLALAFECLASRSFLKNPLQHRHGRPQLGHRIQHKSSQIVERSQPIAPKVLIISLFDAEEEIWHINMPEILSQNVSVPGLSPLFPEVHCTPTGEVCQFTGGEGEINAAVSLTALIYSGSFDFTQTYFLTAGISGVNPHIATTGSVTFARYTVQFDLQYEFDARQIPSNDSSGYFPQGSVFPDTADPTNYPGTIYGTEVFELNENLKQKALYLAGLATLNDTESAAEYRSNYPYAPANEPPKVLACDSGTSDVYWSGSILGDAFSAYTKLLTNGSGTYCVTQQEDTAIAEVLVRGHLDGMVDYSRYMIMRTASDFDRAPPGTEEVFHLLYADQGGFLPAIQNLFLAGNEIVKDILMYWDDTWAPGIEADNYLGDAFNTLDSRIAPDIGTEEIYIN